MRQSNLRARLLSPLGYAVAANLLLTGTWMVLQQQVATPRGLTRSLHSALGFATQPLREETTPTIDLDFLGREVDLPTAFSIRWDGYWFALVERRVTLQARTDGRVNVYVDGDQVLGLEAAGGQTRASTTVTLTSGAHQLVVDYEHEGGDPALSVLWTPSDAPPRALPADKLFVRRLDRRDVYETMAVGWLGWVAFGAWITVPLLLNTPAAGRRLARLEARELRRRTRVLAFPALLGPLQILLFGTYTIYTGNADEFSAPFWRLAVHWLPALATIVAVLIGFGLLISENWFRRYVVVLFSVGLLAWLQGGVLLANYGAFTGEALDWEVHAWRGPYEIGLWVVGSIGMVAAARWVFGVAPFASQCLIALQVLVLVGSAARSGADVTTTFSGRSDFIFELSRTQNVIHIVLDAFQSDVFHEILENDPAVVDSLSGFVFFVDHAGAFRTTVASIPAMLTGEVYRNQEPIQPFVRRIAAQRSLLGVLREHGFETDAVSIHPQGLEPATNAYLIPKPYVSYGEYARFAGWQLVDLSLFRHAPHALKRWVYNDQSWRLQTLFGQSDDGATTQRRYHADNGRAFLDDFVRRVRVNREQPVYKYLHVGIPHFPLVLDADCEFIGVNLSTRDGFLGQATCAANLVTRLLDRLRTLGVYDDSVIVLSSDHGAGMPPKDFVNDQLLVHDQPLPFEDIGRIVGGARALLAVKAAHAAGPLRISNAPTMITDIPATVMNMIGVAESGYSGKSALRLDEDDARERTYAWYRWEDADWKRPYLQKMDTFSIDGPISNRTSWSYAGAIFEPGADLDEVSEGWGDLKTDSEGRRLRSISERVEFYAPPQAQRMTLELRSAAPLPQTMTVTVLVNGEVIDHLTLDDHAWRTVEYPLPSLAEAAAARVDLQVNPPARLRPGPVAERSLGVVARDVQWRR